MLPGFITSEMENVLVKVTGDQGKKILKAFMLYEYIEYGPERLTMDAGHRRNIGRKEDDNFC